MYFHSHRNFKKWTFYSVKILNVNFFLIDLRRNSEKWTFLLHKILKSKPFLIALRRNAKTGFFYCVNIFKCRLFFKGVKLGKIQGRLQRYSKLMPLPGSILEKGHFLDFFAKRLKNVYFYAM